MKPGVLLGLYPRAWRRRYGDEMSDLLREEPLTPRLIADLLLGAMDAHLHPELTEAALLASAGAGSVHLRTPRPRRTLIAALFVTLALLFGWGLSQPLPFIPLILPIGAHASPEAFARSQHPNLPLRVSVERDGIAAVLLANESETVLVTAYRTNTFGWMGGGEARGGGHPPPSAERPLQIVGFASGWSSSAASLLGGGPAHGWVAVEGRTIAEVARVTVIFAGGSSEDLPLRDGAFVWFAARREAPAPPRGPTGLTAWLESTFGHIPSTVVAYGQDGVELARQDVRFPP